MATRLPHRALTLSTLRRTSGLVHDVVVVQRGQVDQLHGDRPLEVVVGGPPPAPPWPRPAPGSGAGVCRRRRSGGWSPRRGIGRRSAPPRRSSGSRRARSSSRWGRERREAVFTRVNDRRRIRHPDKRAGQAWPLGARERIPGARGAGNFRRFHGSSQGSSPTCRRYWRRRGNDVAAGSWRPPVRALSIPGARPVDSSQDSSRRGRRSGVRTLHRPSTQGAGAGAGRSAPAQPQLHRHRAHPSRPHPRGRGRRGQGPRAARHLAWRPCARRWRRPSGSPGRRPRARRRSRPGPRRSSSCPCARPCSSATTTSAPSTCSSASSARARAWPPRSS